MALHELPPLRERVLPFLSNEAVTLKQEMVSFGRSAIKTIKDVHSRLREDPFERFKSDKMRAREFQRRTGGAEGMIQRLEIARGVAEDFTPDMSDEEKLAKIRAALRQKPY